LSARAAGTGWYVAAGAVALAGIGGAVALAAWFVASLGASARFAVPGEGVVEVGEAGTQIVWHEHRTVLGDRTYRAEPEFPGGASFTILAPDGRRLELEPAGQQTWDEGDIARREVGRFVAEVPGRHVLRVEGSFEPRVIAVAPDFTGRMFAAIGGALALGLLGAGGGIGMLVYVLGTRAGASPVARPGASTAPQPTAAPDPQARLREMVTLVYVLQAAALLTGITMVAGVVIDYLSRDEAAGTWLESHVRWQIRTFWWTLAWSVLGVVTLIVLVGMLILLVAAIWYVYRVAKGWVALRAGRPLG